MVWPPAPEAFYLDASEARPIFQGDIFQDVPFVKVKGGSSPSSDPNLDCERRFVATVLHPCDMYAQAGRVLARVQVVALVRSAEGITIPERWDGAYSVCPLPDLRGDGEMWIADFGALSNVDRSYLTVDRRLRSLSSTGWQVFRQRQALAATRGLISLDDLEQIGRETWHETLFETEWCSVGRDAAMFHDWLDASDDSLSGLTRRDALQRGMHEMVRAALSRELNKSG